jgi:hypothetical protein
VTIGALVKSRLSNSSSGLERTLKEYRYGIILDIYEDDYSIVYYEIHWISLNEVEWWKENELELLNEGN